MPYTRIKIKINIIIYNDNDTNGCFCIVVRFCIEFSHTAEVCRRTLDIVSDISITMLLSTRRETHKMLTRKMALTSSGF